MTLPDRASAPVTDAVRLTRFARNALGAAVIRLDDGGYQCQALGNLYADAAGLVAAWHGRHRPSESAPVSPQFAAAAREWRRQNGRSY